MGELRSTESAPRSRLLSERLSSPGPIARGRSGIRLDTTEGKFLELAGGSHATCVVNDNGEILSTALERIRAEHFALTGRALRHPFREELAMLVCQLVDQPDGRVYFTSGGTEAVETSVRLAHHIQKLRGRPDASIVVGRNYSYHGMSVLARNISHHPVHSKFPSGLDLRWPKLPEPRCERCPMGCSPSSCNLECAEVLDELVARHGSENVAAIMVEPIAGTTGAALVPPIGYLKRLSDICRRHGILFIADETVTAFGRVGRALVTDLEVADIVVGGKCLGGGLVPIGAVLLSGALCAELEASPEEIPLRLTFAGNPIACVIASSVQRYIARENLYERVLGHSDLIAETLRRLCSEGCPVAAVSGAGHLWSIQIPVPLRAGPRALAGLKAAAARRNVELMGGFMAGDRNDYVHLMLTPALDATDDELRHSMGQAMLTASEMRVD